MIKNPTRADSVPRPAARTRRRRAAQRPGWKRIFKTCLALIVLAVESAIALVLVGALVIFWNFSNELPSFESIISENREPVATKIWSEDGVLLGKLVVENRQPITLDELGRCRVIDATVAIEDHRFFEHHGIDLVGIARAAVTNLRGSGVKQGASTLTQQLVRQPGIGAQFNLNAERRLSRKIREALVALRVEQLYTKREILQLYLNNVYYGAGAYGIQAAARTYFGKPASALTLGEAALIAGLPQSPSELSPFRHRQAALRRRDEVLEALFEYNKITQAEYDEAKAEVPAFAPRPKRAHFDFKAPYFTTYVLRELTKNYASDMVYSGLSVKTTLNWKIQQQAERALLNGLSNASGLGANQGAIISLDPQTGYIRAMVGGRDFRASQYNAITQGHRQPGSTFKVFDYTAAFDTGTLGLYDTITDRPIPYPNDPSHLVKNYDGGYSYRAMTCKSAIERSTNTVAVQVAQKVGIRKVIEYANRMGISSTLAPYLPTALGASAVRPLDLCSAYSIFAAKGSRCKPIAIVRVSDADNNVLDPNRYLPQREDNILKPQTIAQIDEALVGVVTEGTGTLARGDKQSGIVDNARGKTGTTSDNRDAWFAGYTPELCTVIWVASVHHKGKRLVYAEMPGATGGHQCAPIWHDFMIQAVPIQKRYNELVNRQGSVEPKVVATLQEQPKPRRSRATPAKPNPDANAETAVSPPAGSMNDVPGHEPADSQPDEPDAPQSGDPTTPDSLPDPNTAPAHSAAQPVSKPLPAPGAPVASAPSPSAAALPLASMPERRAGGASTVRPAVPASGRTRTAPPSLRPVAPTEKLVTVNVCGDTGDIANPYCDTFRTIRVTASQSARMRRCRMHKPPPGEGQ